MVEIEEDILLARYRCYAQAKPPTTVLTILTYGYVRGKIGREWNKRGTENARKSRKTAKNARFLLNFPILVLYTHFISVILGVWVVLITEKQKLDPY